MMLFRLSRKILLLLFFFLFVNVSLQSEEIENKKVTPTFENIDDFNENIVKKSVFVILRCLREEKDNILWQRCYKSIREFYPNNLIVIIDDNSNVTASEMHVHNTLIIKSEYPGAGEFLPYYYFLKYEWLDKMIFLHDSMFLTRKFKNSEINSDIKFHWHFESHMWDVDNEIEELLGFLNFSEELIKSYRNKQLWFGCFGAATIINLDILKTIQAKYSLNNLINHISTRPARMNFERILALILFNEKMVNTHTCSHSGNIFNHPFITNYNEVRFNELVKRYKGPIVKTWHGR